MTAEKTRFNLADKRKFWAREDELINHRLNWLGVSQGLLLTGYGVSVMHFAKLSHSIALAGLVTSGLIFVGVCAALLAMYYIQNDGPEEDKKHFGIRGITTILGWISAAGLPLTFFLVWYTLI